MSLKKLVLLPLLLIMLMPLAASAADAPELDGTYTTLPDRQFTYDGGKVEVIEFMSFYCGTCYSFEKSIPVIRGNYPGKTEWKIYPIYWGQGSSKPGEAYLIAVEDGKGEQMKRAIFKARFIDKKDIGDVKVLESLAAEVGLGFDFSRRLRGGEKAAEAQRALQLAQAYRIEETPTLIIAGNISTNPHAFDHDTVAFADNVMEILGSLFR